MAAEADVGAPDDPEAESLILAGEAGSGGRGMIRLVEPGLLLIVVGVVLQVALLALGVPGAQRRRAENSSSCARNWRTGAI